MKTKLIFIILAFALVGMFVTFKILSMINYLEGDEEKFEFFLFWTYNLGAFLTPIIILLLSLFTARTFAKVVYKLGKKVNKLNKALQEHVEDASMHNIKDK